MNLIEIFLWANASNFGELHSFVWTKACFFLHIKVKYGSFSVSQPPRKIAKLSCSKIVHNGVFAADLHKASNWWGKTVWR